MRILIATGIYPPESGGPAQYTSGLALYLTERGHQVSVITYGDISSVSQEDGRTVTHVSRSGVVIIRYLRFFIKAWKLMRGQDVVYLQGATSEGLPVTIAAHLRGVPTVLRVPGDYAWEMSMQNGASSKQHPEMLDEFLMKEHTGKIGLLEKIERAVVRQASRIIVPSRYLQSVVVRWGALPALMTEIKNAEHSLPQGMSREEARRRFNVTDKIVCLTVVRAVPWKGVAELIEWWKELPEPHVLIVGGDGPELEAWKKLAEELGSRVRFVGRLSRVDLADWYRASDAFLLHSGYEGYPHVVAEAASLGVPCLVSDQGGSPETAEVFGDLITVLPFRNREAWVKALGDVRCRMSDVRVGTPKWTHGEMAKRVESILVETAQKQGPLQTIMYSYDRGLFETESDSMLRISNLADDGMVQAVVLSRFKTDEIAQVDHVLAFGFSGPGVVRFCRAVMQGIRSVKTAPNRTVITAQDPFIAGVAGYIVSRIKNVPLEVQEHGDFYSGYWVKESLKNRALSMIGWFVLSQAERVRVVSERVKGHLVTRGVKADKIDVIPVAVDVSALLSNVTRSDGSVFRFVAPCRFVEQKGLDVLLEATAVLKQEQIPFHLSIIGRGPLLPALHGMIEKFGFVGVVLIEDWKDGKEIWKNADGLVLSSRYEGFGRTILEAMAARVAVVSTDVGCVGSLLRPDIDGRVVVIGDVKSLAQAMKTTIVEKEKTKAMIASSHEQAFTFPSMSVLHAKQRDGWQKVLRMVSEVRSRFDLWVLAFVLLLFLSLRIVSCI